jgi:hypothetical protein
VGQAVSHRLGIHAVRLFRYHRSGRADSRVVGSKDAARPGLVQIWA